MNDFHISVLLSRTPPKDPFCLILIFKYVTVETEIYNGIQVLGWTKPNMNNVLTGQP